MECKLGLFCEQLTTELVLIETLWNVNNIFLTSAQLFFHPVLIETLWNVNRDIIRVILDNHTVLIETLWNVNYEKLKWYALGDSCINRNIVECK